MNVGQKLQMARNKQGLTQEQIAQQLQVSRQTISNWENNKSYPDIVSLITLSELYQISLDQLLKGDKAMIEHLSKSTNTVASNRRLLTAIILNIIILIAFILFNSLITQNTTLLFTCFLIALASTTFLFYQIINRI
ncbi:helix-turn-helix domain-containing protein [Streptococcus orisratti]|uniref:helix-turn-helix domain-containing protein n=1 Tax=Streptococcus TaxID=1301 RepID=UPI00047674CE|nr:helix-turn-helix transcriptional regulator [Streptococcus orisratti]MCI7676656.1 helix-turn-helix domain-containing protein [Streptococcus orisratti]MDY4001280.1 helix-turn-helix transcriptional regulator [Streptococcus orisratti]MDY5636652.1 helix-turn-helix transcriptional regulator [Streptococcus orisratti]